MGQQLTGQLAGQLAIDVGGLGTVDSWGSGGGKRRAHGEGTECRKEGDRAKTEQSRAVVLFNGTNGDDVTDPTRVGLAAAANMSVASPLLDLSKNDVRDVARFVGLPNWSLAAAPCLRSRLAFGVEATEEMLRMVELAEGRVRVALGAAFTDDISMRVRIYSRGHARIGAVRCGTL